MYKKLLEWGNKVVRAENKKGRLAVSLVGDIEIRKLNRKYRNIDRATDVLSFEMGEDGLLGDIIISEATAKRNAARFRSGYKEELKRLVIHGALHLLGYDHVKKSDRMKMRSREAFYAKKIR